MIIPPDVQPYVEALVKRCNWLERKNAQQAKQLEQLAARNRQQQQQTWHRRDRADEAQARERRAWQDAERVFG